MKALLLFAVALMLAAGAVAQPVVGIYANQDGSGDCNLQPALFVNNTVWLILSGAPPSHGLNVRIATTFDPGVTMMSWNYSGIWEFYPDIWNGDWVWFYPDCPSSPHWIVSVSFIPLVQPPPCSQFQVLPDPNLGTGQIEVSDCNGNTLVALARPLTINGGGACPCIIDPVAAEPSTWGKVKSLYQ